MKFEIREKLLIGITGLLFMLLDEVNVEYANT